MKAVLSAVVLVVVLAVGASAHGFGLFGNSFTLQIEEILFTNNPGPRISLLGFSGPEQLINELVVIASNRKHGAETSLVEIQRLGVHFRCGNSATSTSFTGNELDLFEVPTDENGQDWQYTQEWCKKQAEYWEEWSNDNLDWDIDEDPASWLCCFAKNWKGPNIHHPSPEVNEQDATKNTGPGGNPWIFIASKNEDVTLECSGEMESIILEDGGKPYDFCKIGKGKGNAGDYPSISFSGNLGGHGEDGNSYCPEATGFCNNHAADPSTSEPNLPGNVFIEIGGEGTTVSCFDIDVILLLSNNEKFTHTVAADDVVLHEVLTLSGSAYFLKSGHHMENGDDSGRCHLMSLDSGYNTDCGTDPSCGGARCGFGGDPQIYYKDCESDTDPYPLVYLTNCNHHSSHDVNPCSEAALERLDPNDRCICECGDSDDRRRSVSNNVTRNGEYDACPPVVPTPATRKFGVREALAIHAAGMPQTTTTTTTTTSTTIEGASATEQQNAPTLSEPVWNDKPSLVF